MKIGPHSFQEFLARVESFHGYAAPGVVLGGIMVEAARRQLPPEVLFDAVCETRNCLPDAVQILTPCTTGNGWLQVINLGRFALSLYDKYQGAGVRVFLDPRRLAPWPEIAAWYLKLKPKKAQDSALLLKEIEAAGWRFWELRRSRCAPGFSRNGARAASPSAPCAGKPTRPKTAASAEAARAMPLISAKTGARSRDRKARL
jgi:formylmethanofuran dehydrogenase subunit E